MGNFIITKLLNFKLVYKFQNMPVLQINDTFASRYLLKKLIGVGGYSQVWLAEDRKSGNLEVAPKIFAPEKGLDSNSLEVSISATLNNSYSYWSLNFLGIYWIDVGF
jgi:hypothetical protein